MNYKLVVSGNQFNGSVGKARVETVPDKDYILLPLWTKDLLFTSSSKDSSSDGFKPSWEEEKKDTEDTENENSEVPSTEEPRVNQEKDAIVNNTNNINTVSPTDNAAGIEDNAIDENIVYRCVDDPNIPDLEEIGRFSDAENDDSGADMNNLDTNLQVSPIPTTRIHKDHPLKQVIRDLHSAPQTRRMSKNLEEHGLVSSKWVFRNKLDERGIVIRNKVRLVALGLTQEEGTDYDEVFTLVVRIKAIRLFLAHASFKDFVVYQMDVKSDFLYEKIKEEIHSKVDGKKVIISETEIRRDLKFKDEGGVDGLSNEVIFEQLTLMGKPRRQDTELPQTSVPTKTVADEAINEEMYDNLERATTTTSLDAEHDRGNI
nr:copia protein [Tanacetum cinerariifolium]